MNTPDDNPVETPKPLRERWPQILRYPLQPAALATVVALALGTPVGLFAGCWHLCRPVVWAALFKYAFEVLRWTANGRDSAPEIALSVSDSIGIYAVLC